MLKKNKKFPKPVRKYKKVALLVLVIIVAAAMCVLYRHRNNGTPGASNTAQTISSLNASAQASTSKGDNNPAVNRTSTPLVILAANLITPYGTFVSNHSPSLSGTSAPSQEESICTTNPGASCYIVFTKDGVIKKLAPQITGGDGSTSWQWDVKKSGFTTGNWLITAVVTSGSNSKSRQDSTMLTVYK